MKKWFYLSALVMVASAISAQNFSVIGDTAQLGNVYENAPDSVLIHVVNAGAYPVAIKNVVGFPFYGDTVVTAQATGSTINAGDSIGIWVKALPEHNLMHKGALLVNMANSPYGSVVIPYSFQGKYSKTYYNATENKTELALRTQLKTTTGVGYVSLSYNGARDEMYGDIDNVNGDVECVYTGRTATFNTRAGANTNSFNCEHTWPQSLFNENLPMKSDIHHLFSTDVTANSQRGNLPFGTVSNPSWTVGGSKKNSSTFEPRDAQKGATARAMMYFVLRYQDYSNFFAGQQSILRQWHEQFPPSATEIQRNNDIYDVQNNRSPFVDYPQFSERITSLVGATVAPTVYGLHVSDDTIYMHQDIVMSTSITYTVNIYNYGNTAVSLNNFSLSDAALQFVGNSGNNSVLEPGQTKAVHIIYPLAGNFSGDELTFQSTVPGMLNVDVPIVSANTFGVEDASWDPSLKITNSYVSWQDVPGDFNWEMIDVSGRTIKKGTNREQQSLHFDGLSTGVYVIKLTAKNKVFATKINVPNL